MRLMGIDFGDARVGIALSDPLMIMSQGYKTILNDGTDSLFEEIAAIIKEKEVTKIIIGLPKNMDNTLGTRAEITIEFKEKLEKLVTIPVHLQDERLTTKSATDMLIMGNVSRKDRKKVEMEQEFFLRV